MESENPLLLLLPLHLMTLNVSCYTVHFLKYWFMSNLVQIKSTRNIFGIKKSLKKYLTSICCIMYTSFQDSMDESGSRPNLGFGMNFESFILKLRNWSLVFQKEGK